MKLFISSLIFASIFLTGCAANQPLNTSLYPNIEIAPSVKEDFQILHAASKVRGDGLSAVEIELQNKTNYAKAFTYKVNWYDSTGFHIKSIMSNWKEKWADPNKSVFITAISPSAKAATYKVQIIRTINDNNENNIN